MRKPNKWGILFLFLFLSANAVFSQQFQAPVQIGEGGRSASLAAADFNGDGYMDFVCSALTPSGVWTTSKVTLYLNDGTGHFRTNLLLSRTVGAAINASLTTADINCDGKPDIILNQPGKLMKFINIGNAIFATNSFGTGLGEGSICAADLNNDGSIDLVYSGNNAYYKALNDGKGNFAETPLYGAYGQYSAIAIGDLRSIGTPDIIFMGYQASGLILTAFNDGKANFTMNNTLLQGYFGDLALIKLLSNDSWNLVACGVGFSSVMLLKNNGSGTFSASGIAPYLDLSTCSVMDINIDGMLDAITSGRTGGSPFSGYVLLNQSGTLSVASALAQSLAYSSSLLVDMNNDNKPDLIMAGITYPANIPMLNLYINASPIANSAPTTPTHLRASQNSSNWLFAWDDATDDHTTQSMIRYQIAIGTNTPGTYDYISEAFTPQRGQPNFGLGFTHYQSSICARKDVFFKVRAIDTSMIQGPWSEEFHANLQTAQITPVNKPVNSPHPAFQWIRGCNEKFTFQLSSTSNGFNSPFFATNLVMITQFTLPSTLPPSTTWWRVLEIDSDTGMTNIIGPAYTFLNSSLPTITLDPKQGSLKKGSKLTITAQSSAGDAVTVTAAITKNNVPFSSHAGTNTLLLTFTDAGQYILSINATDTAGNTQTISSYPVSVVDLDSADGKKTGVFPSLINPLTTSRATIAFEGLNGTYEVKICSLDGRLLLSIPSAQFIDGVYEWNLADIGKVPQGMILFKVNGKTAVAKIKKE